MNICWKITLATLVIGSIAALVGGLVDASLGFYTNWGAVAICGMGAVLVGLVEIGLLSIRGI